MGNVAFDTDYDAGDWLTPIGPEEGGLLPLPYVGGLFEV
jgi:hypothetical protein